MPTNEDAEDVVQESFQLAFTHFKNFKGDPRFSTWLTRIVTNAALMRLIQGIGGLGHLGVQFARQMGFRTVAIGVEATSKSLPRIWAHTSTSMLPSMMPRR